MSTLEKLRGKLKARPKTYNWDDMKRVLADFGYLEKTGGKTSGSRIKFTHPNASPILLHKPHPSNEVKKYAIDLVVDKLEMEGFL